MLSRKSSSAAFNVGIRQLRKGNVETGPTPDRRMQSLSWM